MKTIGQRIKELRLKSGLSLQQMAELVGKSKGNISGYENDKFQPSAQTIIAISRHFNVSTDWLLMGEYSTDSRSLDKEAFLLYRELDEQDRKEVLEFIRAKRNPALEK